MVAWMILWCAVLVFSVLAFFALLVYVGSGAIGELNMTLEDLRGHPDQSVTPRLADDDAMD